MRQQRGTKVSSMAVKAIGIFSGVQAVSIVCSIIRTKLVALWLGPVGVGLFGLFNSAFDSITSLTQLGLRNSAVRDVAASKDDESKLARLSVVVGRWAWALGIVGAFITLVLSPLLSRLTFSDSNHTLGFIVLSIAVFFSSMTNSPLVMLQGMGRLKQLAKASLWGAIAGLVVSVPLYYFMGIRSVVPSIVAYSIAGFAAAWLHRVRFPRPEPMPIAREVVSEGLGFIKLGIFMTVSVFLSLAANYVFIAFLNNRAGTTEVGYYQAGYTLVSRYAGLVFTAIVMEYYPRLSSVVGSKMRVSAYVGHEMIVCVLVVMAVATSFMAVDDVAIMVLYDGDFTVVAPYVAWALVGTVLRAASWCLSITIIARGDGKTYLVTEGISAAMFVALSFAGWELCGLEGLGVAYLAWYAVYAIIVGVVYFRRYRLRLSRNAILVTVAATVVVTSCALLRSADLRWPVIVIAVVSFGVTANVIRKML